MGHGDNEEPIAGEVIYHGVRESWNYPSPQSRSEWCPKAWPLLNAEEGHLHHVYKLVTEGGRFTIEIEGCGL